MRGKVPLSCNLFIISVIKTVESKSDRLNNTNKATADVDTKALPVYNGLNENRI